MQSLYDEAQDFFEKQNFDKALEIFKQILPYCSDFSVLNYIGCCYLGTHEYASAESIFKDLISKAPDWERPYFNLARVYIEIGQDDKAYELLQKAIEINPLDEDVYFYMGVYYRKKGQWEKAIDYFLKSEIMDENGVEVNINLSACYAQIGDYEKALERSLMALEIDSSDPDALFNASKILIALKDYEKAFELLYENYAGISNDIGLLKKLFISALKIGNFNVSAEAAKKILAIDENDSLAKRFLSDIESSDIISS